MRRGLFALVVLAALAACEPANDTQRLAVHRQACEGAGLPDARITACSLVVDAPNATPPQKVEALIDRGMLRVQQRQDERAFADFGQALRFDAQNTLAYVQRGLLHQKRGAFGEAVVDFEAAGRTGHESNAANYRDAAIAAQAPAFHAQIARLDEQIATTPSNATLYNARCWLRGIINEDLNGALADCDHALQLAPNSAEFLDSRGLVNLKLANYQAALADYEAALRLEPERGHFQYGRGLARFALGMLADAETDWRASEAAEPGIAALYRSYGIRLPDDTEPLAR